MAENAIPKLQFVDATLYTLAIGTGIRWIAVAAASGPSALPLWALALFTFYLPLVLAASEFTARFESEGGIYIWTRESLGPLAGFLCGWFYWISLMPFFAGALIFMSNLTIATVGGDAGNGVFSLAISIAISLLVTAVQLAGLDYGKWVPNFGTAGGWIVIFVIVAMAAVLGFEGKGATDFVHASYLPRFNFDTAILWGTIFFAYSGVEALAFLRNEVEGGLKTIVRVFLIVGLASLFIYIVGTSSFLVVLPQSALTRLAGFPDALKLGLVHVGLGGLAAPVIALFALSMLGGFTGWFGVAARLPFAAGLDHFLPQRFAYRHPRTGAPVFAILLQGGIMLAMLFLCQAGTSAAGAYDLLVSMSILTVALPYVFLFAAWLKCLGQEAPHDTRTLPVGRRTRVALAWVGQISTLIAIACSLAPDSGDAHPLLSFFKIMLMAFAMTVVGLFYYWLAARRKRAAAAWAG